MIKIANCSLQEHEHSVQPGLALTPSFMDKCVREGIPITSQIDQRPEMFYDGDDNPSFDILPEMRKGVDPADLWENERVVRRKAKKGAIRDVDDFGVNNTSE